MARQLVALILIAVMVVVANGQGVDSDLCPPNQVWNECGSACPQTCKPRSPDQNCLAVCVKGCQCKPGYVYNDNRVCIPYSECEGAILSPFP